MDFALLMCFKPLSYTQKTGNREVETNLSSLSYGPERNSASTVRLPNRCSLTVKSVANRRAYRPDNRISMPGQLIFFSKRKVLYVKSPHEVSKPLYLLFTESHTEEKPISSAELVLSPYLRSDHGSSKFLNVMKLITIA